MKRWFFHNWMYTGLIAGLFLLALVPLLARTLSLPLLLVYLQLPVYMIHQVEEHHGDRFRRYVNGVMANGREVLSTEAVVVINIGCVWVVNMIALYLARFVDLGLGLIAVYLTLINALVHILGALAKRSYNPGLVTAVLLFLPVGLYALIVMSRTSGVTMADQIIAIAFAILVHIAIVMYVRWRMAALPAEPAQTHADMPST
ncbi:MAG: HXXEE domain-containing protein [Thermodesulfobacteriota bacterium]